MDNIYYKFKCPAKTNNERNLRDYHTKVVLDEYYMSVLNSKNEIKNFSAANLEIE